MKHRRLTALRFCTHLGVGTLGLLCVVAVSPGVGSQPIGLQDAWEAWGDPTSSIHNIAFQLRLPRTVRAVVVGVSLAMAGAVFQTVYRNALATPYTLGIASGGSLGALISIKIGWAWTFLGLPALSWSAFAGCAAVLAAVLLLASSAHRLSGNSLILAGVTIGLFCSAMMMFVTYLADVKETFSVVRWMMGNLEKVGHADLWRVVPVLAAAWVGMLCFVGPLNQWELGEEIAASRGVRSGMVQVACIGFASLATACVVSLCGPIGFVGLIVPHMVRVIVGRDHRLLLPAAAIWGGIFLAVCDWLTTLVPHWYGVLFGREVTAAALPIGVMTALLGAPLFLILLRSRPGGL